MFRGGYWVLGRFRGARVRLHWSILLGAFVFGGFRLSLTFLIAYPLLILVHELGHAVVAAHFGHRVVGIEATALGGICQWSGNASPFEEAVIAWGGVMAQFGLFLGTELWLSSPFAPNSLSAWQIASIFTHTNLYLIAVNLLPVPPLDGARAWTLFSVWKDRGTKGSPYGTWRDPDRNAQRAWFDDSSANRRTPKNGKRARREGAPANVEASSADDAALDAEGQRAIDELVRRATGKGRRSNDRDP